MVGIDDIPPSVREEVHSQLAAIACQEQVKILFACESGSRAWGFESTNSDYDVRFIYRRDEDWYLSIDVERGRDVIERPINDDLDISGWDIRKALQLMRKSNPPLLEWLGSPIVYSEIQPFADDLRALSNLFYSPRACLHHYLSMAKGNIREYLKGDQVRRKKYLYVLRPLLAVRWIERFEGMPSTEFAKLVSAVAHESNLREAIGKLVEQKRLGQELDWGPRIPALSDFIDSEMERHANETMDVPGVQFNSESLNEFFRATVKSDERAS